MQQCLIRADGIENNFQYYGIGFNTCLKWYTEKPNCFGIPKNWNVFGIPKHQYGTFKADGIFGIPVF